jgi:hypothetical protein
METQLRQETDDDRQMFVYLDDDGWFESSALPSTPASQEVQDPSARSSGVTNGLGWSDLASTDAVSSRPHTRIASYEVTEDGVARSGMELLAHRLGTDLAQHKAAAVGERAGRLAGPVITLLAHEADCDECLTVEYLTVVGSSRRTGARSVTVAPDHPWRSTMSAGDWSRRRKQHVALVSEQMLILNKSLNGIEDCAGGFTMHQMRLNIPTPAPLVDGTGSERETERETERPSRHAADASGEAKSDTSDPLRSIGVGQPKITDDRATERIEDTETRALKEQVRRLQQRLAAAMHLHLSENRALQEQVSTLTKHQYLDHHPRTKHTLTPQDAEVEEILMELTSLRRGRRASAGDIFGKGTPSSLSIKHQAGRRGSAGDVVSAEQPNVVESITPSSPFGAIAVSAGTSRGARSSPRFLGPAELEQRATRKQEEEPRGGQHRVSSLPSNFPSDAARSPSAQKLREEYEEDLTTLNRIRKDVDRHRGPRTVHFVPARGFSGIWPGYVFKMGVQGMGYYSDVTQQQLGSTAETAAPKTPRASSAAAGRTRRHSTSSVETASPKSPRASTPTSPRAKLFVPNPGEKLARD